MVIDLSPMKEIRVDPAARTAAAGAGLTWGEFDSQTQRFGLATPGGIISTTGIAGFTLGGGIGWLLRKHGLTCDNLLAAEVVTADGKVLTASETDNPDLLWGLRGGGGNFGVVTLFHYRLHPVSQVLGGSLLYSGHRARELYQLYRQYAQDLPDELTSMMTLVTARNDDSIPAALQGGLAVSSSLCYAGPMEEGKSVLRPLREQARPVLDQVRPLSYTALQSMFEAGPRLRRRNYWMSVYLRELSDDAIDTILSYARCVTSTETEIEVRHMGGAAGHVGLHHTAFGNREAPFLVNIVCTWSEPSGEERHVGWTHRFWQALQPFAAGGAYVNFMPAEGAGQDPARQAYGLNYERLAALKARFDPDNFFGRNQRILPAAPRAAT